MAKTQPKVESSSVEIVTVGSEELEVIGSPGVTALARVESFADALNLARQTYGEAVITSFELGDGFVGLPDRNKDALVGVPLVILGWGLGWSAFSTEDQFSILRVVTADGHKYRFSDGSSGIHRTLMERFEGDPANFRAIVALGGLRKSQYTPRNPDGSPVVDGKGNAILNATTYFIDVETLTMDTSVLQ